MSGGAETLALSPDDEQIAFVCDGEVFAMKTSEDEPYAYDVSQSDARDGEATWAPDAKSLVFVSDRDGNRDLYRARPADPSEPRLARSLRVAIDAADERSARGAAAEVLARRRADRLPARQRHA